MSQTEPLFEATRHYHKERDSSSDEDDIPLMVSWLVSWCFKPSQPEGITLGLKTNLGLSPSLPLMELRRRFRAREQRLKGRVLESEREMSEEDVPVDKSANIDAVRCHRHRNSKDIFFTRGNCEDIIILH